MSHAQTFSLDPLKFLHWCKYNIELFEIHSAVMIYVRSTIMICSQIVNIYFYTCYVTSFGKLWNRMRIIKDEVLFFMEIKVS